MNLKVTIIILFSEGDVQVLVHFLLNNKVKKRMYHKQGILIMYIFGHSLLCIKVKKKCIINKVLLTMYIFDHFLFYIKVKEKMYRSLNISLRIS